MYKEKVSTYGKNRRRLPRVELQAYDLGAPAAAARLRVLEPQIRQPQRAQRVAQHVYAVGPQRLLPRATWHQPLDPGFALAGVRDRGGSGPALLLHHQLHQLAEDGFGRGAVACGGVEAEHHHAVGFGEGVQCGDDDVGTAGWEGGGIAPGFFVELVLGDEVAGGEVGDLLCGEAAEEVGGGGGVVEGDGDWRGGGGSEEGEFFCGGVVVELRAEEGVGVAELFENFVEEREFGRRFRHL